jgi:predicted ATPase/DNA-binding CsgD family transcriptional regulator
MTNEQEGQWEEEDLSNNSTDESIDKKEGEQLLSGSVNVPALLTSFVGRERELETTRALLLRPDVRLLTLSGAGGVGKTRLAIVVVNKIQAQFVNGIYFVPLASLADAEQVLPTIAHTLGIQNIKDQSFLELLIAVLHTWHGLLVLDNFERVLEAAPAIIDLLKACPHLKILVTSRAILHVQGEYEFIVPPLTLPELNSLSLPDRLIQSMAVRLFVQRAQAVRHDFTLTEQNAAIVAEICIRLDGLPLAIELAAPFLKLMSPALLLQRLENRLRLLTGGSRDLHERQKTLRDTIKWSYDILTLNEKKLCRRLSPFVGGFTIEAVESICQLNNDLSLSVLDILSALLNKSLIHQFEQARGEPRLVMMGTIRDFGLECLATTNEEEAIRRQHAEYYLQWMETADLQLYGHKRVAALTSVERELNNVRQALQWFLQHEQAESALRLAGATGRFWFLRGLAIREYLHQGQRFLELVLPFLENEGNEENKENEIIPLQLRAKLLLNYGVLLGFLDDVQQAETLGKECLELYQRLQAPQGLVQAYWLLAYCAQRRAIYEEARVLGEEALRLAIHLHHDFARAFSLKCIALSAFFTGNYVCAVALFEESLFFAQKIHDPILLAQIARHLAEVYYAQGDHVKAGSFCEESLAQSRLITMNGNSAWSQTLLASILWFQGEVDAAFRYAEEALDEHTTVNDQRGIVWTTLWLARIAAHRQQLELARKFRESVLLAIRIEPDRWYTSTFLELLADSAVQLEEKRWSVRLWSRAATLREEIHAPLAPVEQKDYEAARVLVQKSLGETTFKALWAEGRCLSVEQVLDLRNSLVNPEMPEVLQGNLSSLTRRELEVLRLLATGQSNARIAEQLTISRVTVNSYLRSIYNKLEVSSRTAAMRYAIDHRLI